MTEHLALMCGETHKPFDFYRETEARTEKKILIWVSSKVLRRDLFYLMARFSSESNLHIFVWCANKHTHNIYLLFFSLFLQLNNHTIFVTWKFDCCCLLPPGNRMTTAHGSSTATRRGLPSGELRPSEEINSRNSGVTKHQRSCICVET